jgi:hypothetical protein
MNKFEADQKLRSDCAFGTTTLYHNTTLTSPQDISKLVGLGRVTEKLKSAIAGETSITLRKWTQGTTYSLPSTLTQDTVPTSM